MVMDDAAGKAYQGIPAAGQAAAFGMYQMAAAYPLPLVATFASCTTNAVPLIALTTRDLI
jgi:hypothetical protein